MKIVELGPSHAPIAAKRDGWRVVVVDHAPREALVDKYEGHPGVDTSRIEEVDVVWAGAVCTTPFRRARSEPSMR